MSNLVLQNEQLLICVNSLGATLTSVYDKKTNRELLWQADEKSWNEQDICIFPHVARLKDGYYEVDGKQFELPIHGFCKLKDFVIKKHSSEHLEMVIQFDEETLSMYPYKFEFTVLFELNQNKLCVTYNVKNLDNKTIYYGIGGHPGFALDGSTNENGSDISGNSIILNKNNGLEKVVLDDSNYFVRGFEKYPLKDNVIHLSKEIFANDAIILKNNFGGAILERKNGSKILFESESNYLAFWTHAKFGEYVCFEPWWTLPDDENPNRELKDKSSIISLGVGESKEHTYSIKVIQ